MAIIFITVELLSERLGLPVAWLKREAKAGRLPHIHASRRLMFDQCQVEAILSARAEAASNKQQDAASPTSVNGGAD